ncbi:hypothetical protein RJ640_030591 [Escallonia rubra]|uniref:Uncharacterized protein n=1 Tax=Escallonia rubra TaxID=112253 RepID=A0AA88R2Z3_9ASTE|nr:hypothetical protein RJ640_030591 [Escallonia rubra]
MAKSKAPSKVVSFLKARLPFVGGALAVSLFLAWALWSSANLGFSMSTPMRSEAKNVSATYCTIDAKQQYDPPEETFYDDPRLSYSIEERVKNWDEKRREWLKHHPSFNAGVSDRIFVLTGSQPSPCYNPTGDYLHLKLFKNKVDYCRIHGYGIFYNNAILHPKMPSYWAKTPLLRAAMTAHPEAEWILWVDSDAVFTDMEFKLPLDRYKNHNLVVDGWPDLIYEKRSWIGLNAGVLLFRNCQWSMDFMDDWASMGPQSPDYEKWGQVLKSTLKDKTYPISDDQSALVYLLLKQEYISGKKIYLENEYCFQCYWARVVNQLDDVTEKYVEIEKRESRLRRRHAEVVSESYGALREQYLQEAWYGKETGRKPFITHFTGCQPCSGDHNPKYAGDSCHDGMARALNFADNQVLRNYGFVHSYLNSSSVTAVPFDSPGM